MINLVIKKKSNTVVVENMSFIQTHLMVILPGAGLATNAIQVELGGNWFSANKLGENGGYLMSDIKTKIFKPLLYESK